MFHSYHSTFHECTLLYPFFVSTLIRMNQWQKLAAIMPRRIVGEILFDLLCAKVKFIIGRHMSLLCGVSSIIPAVN